MWLLYVYHILDYILLILHVQYKMLINKLHYWNGCFFSIFWANSAICCFDMKRKNWFWGSCQLCLLSESDTLTCQRLQYLLPAFLLLWVLEEWSLTFPDKYLCFASIQNHVLVGDLCWSTGVFSATESMCWPEPCCPMQGGKLTAQLPFSKFLLPRIQQQDRCLSLCNAELCWLASALIPQRSYIAVSYPLF